VKAGAGELLIQDPFVAIDEAALLLSGVRSRLTIRSIISRRHQLECSPLAKHSVELVQPSRSRRPHRDDAVISMSQTTDRCEYGVLSTMYASSANTASQ
jgi:hypothetical protein